MERTVRYTEAIQSGSRIINKNWQLVLIQVGAMFVSFVGFFIVVGIPLAIAFIIFGLDLTELSRFEDVFRTFREPSEILSKYFALVILVLTSLLLYITAVLAVGIFFFGGSIGVISRSITGSAEKFQARVFLSEGKRLFFPLIGFTSLVGLIFILVAFVLGLFGGLISAVVSIAREQEATLALFLGVFFSLILFVIGLTLILVTLSVTAYGSAIMAVRGEGPVKSLKESVRYLYAHSHAFYLYCLVFFGYLIVSFLVVSVSYPLGMIPLIGSLLALVYHFGAYVIQSYLGLVMIATLFCYYYFSTTVALEEEQGPPPAVTPPGDFGEKTDTSEPQAPGQGGLPPERDPSSGI
ncbi:MAG: hypothetical protein M1508_02010 [Nitrospirae bacterium]|nr:hypothetical protein [Nitrospirota bacterium]MCL5421320.1 hypothetical protein [Nitrospirota bacterium]